MNEGFSLEFQVDLYGALFSKFGCGSRVCLCLMLECTPGCGSTSLSCLAWSIHLVATSDLGVTTP